MEYRKAIQWLSTPYALKIVCGEVGKRRNPSFSYTLPGKGKQDNT